MQTARSMKIEEEINQKKPFKDNYQKLGVNILFTASWLTKMQTAVLKPLGLTIQQFNILRILRGMKGEPATVKLLTTRMIDKMSNASRLVDKLVNKGYVERLECKEDRRRVDIFITQKGLNILTEASDTLENAMTLEMSAISEEEATIISDLLDKMRD
jgi:DNA-binding MarR family transcriptional regulator